jgi:DNA-binding transcriptional ArsR family regulator
MFIGDAVWDTGKMSQHSTRDPTDGGSFADETPLVELLGDHARPRILAVLTAHKSREFNVSELARYAGVSRNTIYDHIEALEEAGAVEARETAQGSRYTLADTEVGEKVWELEGVTLSHLAQ